MQAIKVMGEVDGHGRLIATVPDSVEPGPVEILVIAPERGQSDAEESWMTSIAHEWHDDLSDPRQDIYSLTDGAPVDRPR
jgi:hypothetical protein